VKALILAGGKGTRLRPITYTSAKQLVPIANKPILFYGIEAIREAGITDIGFVVGDTRREIADAVGDGSAWGITPSFIEQEAPLGLAHAVKIARSFIGADDFVMFLGDNLLKRGVIASVEAFQQDRPNAQILLTRVPNPQDFGVAEVRDGRVIRLREKPRKPASDLALVGVYIFDSSIFEAVETLRPSARGELEITDAIQYLIDHKRVVRHHVVEGWWKGRTRRQDFRVNHSRAGDYRQGLRGNGFIHRPVQRAAYAGDGYGE